MEKTIDVKGTKVHINGNGSAVIVMVHGWPDTHEIWNKQVDFFKKDYTCVTFTLPGFNRNDTSKYTLDDIVNRIKDIVDTVLKKLKKW